MRSEPAADPSNGISLEVAMLTFVNANQEYSETGSTVCPSRGTDDRLMSGRHLVV